MAKHVMLITKVRLSGNVMEVSLPGEYPTAVRSLMESKNTEFLHLTIGTPQKPVSTGRRSEMNMIHGLCACVCEQLGYYEEMNRKDAVEYVKRAMKRIAVGDRGYPSRYNDIDGYEEPMSLSIASSEQAQMVIDTLLDFCAANHLWVVAYDEQDVPFKYYVDTGEIIEYGLHIVV